jgi:multicomponent Na+:H+ antiporter subunit E
VITWPLRIVAFLVWFVRQVVVANLRVARQVLTPGLDIDAAIVEVPTRCRTTLELVVFANCITLTPGTITLEADEKARVLYVHGMFVADRDAFLAGLAGMETRILRAMRRDGDRGEVAA